MASNEKEPQFRLRYGGVPLVIPTPEIQHWIESRLTLADVLESLPQPWPASRLAGSTSFADPLTRPLRLNCLRWPNGASDYAVGHFLISEADLETLLDTLATAGASGSGSGAGASGSGCGTGDFGDTCLFEMWTDPADKIETQLSMLPPRPMAQLEEFNGFYLLTLVDERFWWWNADIMGFPAPPQTWQAVLDAAFAAVGVNAEIDPIDDAFMYPACEFEGSYEPVPMILDAVAYNTQHNLVRLVDGTVRLSDVQWSVDTVVENLDQEYPPIAGGLFRIAEDDDRDIGTILPKRLSVGVRDGAGWKTYSADIADGTRGIKTYRCFALANQAASGSGSGSGAGVCDDEQLQAYVDKFAQQWAKQVKAGYVERCFEGVRAWVPDGVHDAIEWSMNAAGAKTRVRRRPWHDGVHVLMARCDPAEICMTAGGACQAAADAAIVRCIDFVHDFQCLQLAITKDIYSIQLTQCAVDFLKQIGFFIESRSCAEQGSGSGDCP